MQSVDFIPGKLLYVPAAQLWGEVDPLGNMLQQDISLQLLLIKDQQH
jgi:hypothetical protein